MPKYLIEQCKMGHKILLTDYICYHQIILAPNSTVDFHFMKFQMNSGSLTNCFDARQFLEITSAENTAERYEIMHDFAERQFACMQQNISHTQSHNTRSILIANLETLSCHL